MCSKESCQSVHRVESGFVIDIEPMNQIFENLFDEESGSIKKAPNDYDIRAGQTFKPIPETPTVSGFSLPSTKI
jgi:hypothetical protein